MHQCLKRTYILRTPPIESTSERPEGPPRGVLPRLRIGEGPLRRTCTEGCEMPAAAGVEIEGRAMKSGAWCFSFQVFFLITNTLWSAIWMWFESTDKCSGDTFFGWWIGIGIRKRNYIRCRRIQVPLKDDRSEWERREAVNVIWLTCSIFSG